jgi:mono/diheme cytochrome c family protein
MVNKFEAAPENCFATIAAKTARRGALVATIFSALLLTTSPSEAFVSVPPLPANVAQIFQAHCVQCHTSAPQDQGHIGSILDVNNLLLRGLIIPAKPELSPIIQKTSTGEMPIGGPRLSFSDLTTLRTWIAALPPSTLPSGPTPTPGGNGSVPVSIRIPTTSVLQLHVNPNRDGNFVEPTFTKDAVKRLHLVPFAAQLDGDVHAQPLYVEKGAAGRDVLIVATETNRVYGFDGRTGRQIWQRSLGSPATRTLLPCGNIDPLGITGTPIVDAASNTMLFDTMTIENGNQLEHKIHRLSVADGTEQMGWPVSVTQALAARGLSFNAPNQNQRGALQIVSGKVFVPYGAHFGDCGDYHGWVIGIDLTNPSLLTAWKTSGPKGGSWAPGGVTTDGTSVYFTTANAPATASHIGAESIQKLPPSLRATGAPTEFFSPLNWATLGNQDSGLGGVAPMLIDAPSATPSQLVVSLGKDGFVYVVDRNHLGGISSPIVGREISNNILISVPTFFTTPRGTFIVFKGRGTACPSFSSDLTALKINPTTPLTISTVWCASQNGTASPIVTTTNGYDNAVVWGIGAEGDDHLRGFDAQTGATLFDSGDVHVEGVQRFQSAIVVSGRMFVVGLGKVYVFSAN